MTLATVPPVASGRPDTTRRRRTAGLVLGGLTALLAATALPQAAGAAPGDWLYDYDRAAQPSFPLQPPPPPQRSRSAYGPGYGGAYPLPRPPIRGDRTAYGYGGVPVDPAVLDAQMAQRCNVGRLVGGLVGGGIGYAASRQDGRSWAVPLGALVGQQMGCSIGAGRSPLPW